MEQLDRFQISLDVTIRPCRREDLPALEWFGLFHHQRDLIEAVYDRSEKGEAIILVVEANGEPSGQAWIDLDRCATESIALLWAVRILPNLQKRGIGSRLVVVSERLARERGCRIMEITVEKHNPGARRLYERLGYLLVGSRRVKTPSAPAAEKPARQPAQWVLRKRLDGDEHPRLALHPPRRAERELARLSRAHRSHAPRSAETGYEPARAPDD